MKRSMLALIERAHPGASNLYRCPHIVSTHPMRLCGDRANYEIVVNGLRAPVCGRHGPVELAHYPGAVLVQRSRGRR